MEEIKYWAILEEDNETPVFGGNIINLDKLPTIQSGQYEYNQNEFASKYGYCNCTAYWPIWAVSSNLKFEIPLNRREQIIIARDKVRFDPKVWGYIKDWAEIVAWMCNAVAYQIPKQRITEFRNKGYRVVIGMYVWNDYKTFTQDWHLTNEEIDKIKDTKYWHCLTIQGKWIVDNYKWVLPDNTTDIDDLDKFINSWFVFNSAYIIIGKDILKQMFKTTFTWNYQTDANRVVELMKNKQIYPTEFEVAQELLKEIYLHKKQ